MLAITVSLSVLVATSAAAPEQIHIAFGHTPDTMSVQWAVRDNATCSTPSTVQFGADAASLASEAAGACTPFNLSGQVRSSLHVYSFDDSQFLLSLDALLVREKPGLVVVDKAHAKVEGLLAQHGVEHALQDLAKVLQRSPFYVLLSFRKVTEWWSYGLVKIQPVAKLPGFRTTGGEGMTCFFYVNVEKLPAQ